MLNSKKLRKNIIKTSLLTTIMLTHTGCFFGYFENPFVPIEKPTSTPQKTTINSSSTPVNVVFPTTTPAVECTNEVTSNCKKPPIKPDELKPKIETSTGGEIHNLKTIKGKKITIVERSNGFVFPEYKNRVVVLEMFGKECPHCIKEIPIFNKLKRKYGKNIEVIAIQVEDKMSSHEANHFIKRHRIKYPIISGETATNLQYNIQNTYGWTGILPFTMVIKNGVTEFSYPGTVSYREINKDISSILTYSP